MKVTLSGTVRLVRVLQPKNAQCQMLVTLPGIVYQVVALPNSLLNYCLT